MLKRIKDKQTDLIKGLQSETDPWDVDIFTREKHYFIRAYEIAVLTRQQLTDIVASRNAARRRRRELLGIIDEEDKPITIEQVLPKVPKGYEELCKAQLTQFTRLR